MSDEKSLVKNAADEKQVKKAKRAEKTDREKELDDLRFVLGTPQGRRVLHRVLSQCGVYRPSFTGNRFGDFNEGQRNIGLYLLSEITEAKESRLYQMQQENKPEYETRKGD